MSSFFEYYSFIAYLIIGSVYCFGVFKVFDDLLISVRERIEYILGAKWSRPIVSCPPCMGSFHGMYLGFMFFGLSWSILLYCVCLCGLNYIVNSLLPDYD